MRYLIGYSGTTYLPCPSCKGLGSVTTDLGEVAKCLRCGGTGYLKRPGTPIYSNVPLPMFGSGPQQTGGGW